MALTIEDYHKLNANQRKKIKRDALQKLVEEHLNTDGTVNSIRGIIRDELNTKFDEIKSELNNKVDSKFNTLVTENEKLSQENALIKKVDETQGRNQLYFYIWSSEYIKVG